MTKLNHHFTKLSDDNLFAEIARKIAAFKEKNSNAPLLNLAAQDSTRPLAPSIALALENGAKEMSQEATYKGYGPSLGYSFLREAIAQSDYRNVSISAEEIFISDSAKGDLTNIGEIFAAENRIAVPDPIFPAYVDSNVIAGRTRLHLKTGGYGGVVYLPCNQLNHFIPELPNRPCDIIYLSSPSNATGIAMKKQHLEEWVHFAHEHQAVILFEGTYEAYIRSPDCPRTIYEIEGAQEVAIEIRSFSKTASFTGLRCAYTVIPHALKIAHGSQKISLHSLWKKRQETKFNGVSYPIQKAASAIYSKKGQEEVKQIIDSYLWQAISLRKNLIEMGFTVFGGMDAPYLWLKTPQKLASWDFFDLLLNRGQIICVPGSGLGNEGEGYVRLSCFASAQTIAESVKKFKELC